MMTDPLFTALMQVVAAHEFVPEPAADVMTVKCTCGKWQAVLPSDDDYVEWEEHRAAQVYTTILATGRLLPEENERYELFATCRLRPPPAVGTGPDGTWLIRNSLPAARRTARIWGNGAYPARAWSILWPDGTELRTPWIEVDINGPTEPIDDTPTSP
jgi:hypothetical protein